MLQLFECNFVVLKNTARNTFKYINIQAQRNLIKSSIDFSKQQNCLLQKLVEGGVTICWGTY